jgi:MFS transporter, DHA1 family, multidrug resistance protein
LYEKIKKKDGFTLTWKRTMWTMAAVQCIMMMAFTSMGAFLALYIEQLGVHDPKAVDIWTGVISSSNFLVTALVSPLWGSVADRKGRKLMVLRSTLAISIFTCLMGFTRAPWELLVVRALQGGFSGFSAAATALVSTSLPEERLGYALGWIQSAGMVGSLMGPLAGGIAADLLHSYRTVFFLTSGLAMMAFLITLLFVKEPFEAPKPGKTKPSLWQQFRMVKEMKGLRTMFVVLFLTQFSVMNVQPVLPVFLKELTGGSAFLGTMAGFAFSVTGMADLIGSPFLGRRSDKVGYKKVLLICMAGAGLFYLPQALAPNFWVFVLSRFGLGLFVGGILPTANALIARMTPIEERGKIFGLTASAMFLGNFSGPLIGGLGSSLFGIRAMLGLTCLLYFVNLLWVRSKVQEPVTRPLS